MGRRRRTKPFYSRVTIEDIGAEGKSLAKVDGKVVFTKLAVPGDVVDLQVFKKRKNYQEATVTQYHEYSDLRIEPFCEHFGICGGCKWQHLPYELQLSYKQKQVKDQLSRIGRVDLPKIKPILPSKETTFYRNKLEFTFSNKSWIPQEVIDSDQPIEHESALGFHVPGVYDKVVDIEKCWLQEDPSNQIRNFVEAYAKKNDYEFFDIKEQKGFLRTLIIRTSTTGEIMVILTFYKEDIEKRTQILDAVINEFPQITSLYYVINTKGNDTIGDQELILYRGNEVIFEKMDDLQFEIGPKSFYQTNSEQAYNLYKVAKDFAQLNQEDVVYDLYTGTGTIANFVARDAQKVVGIEYVEEAIESAKKNSEQNDISNTSFYAGDMKDVLNDDFITKNGKPSVVITDPPRAGMHTNVVEKLISMNPQRIVYVSCNPATQARDIQLLSENYSVKKIQPVDMFPHTHHVENVVLLERN